MKIIFREFILTAAFFSSLSFGSNNADEDFKSLISEFEIELKHLQIPDLELSYFENFYKIQNSQGIQQQIKFFQKYDETKRTIRRADLSKDLKYQYDAMQIEIDLNFERLNLEKEFQESGSKVSRDGIYNIANNKLWYQYYVKKWTSRNITPQKVYQLGHTEVERVSSEIRMIQKKLGYEGRSSEFYEFLNSNIFQITDESILIKSFDELQDRIKLNLASAFEETNISKIPVLPIPNPTKDSPPGYYEDGKFYFNFFNHFFRLRTLEWLFIHEAIPGHHYQISLSKSIGNKAPFTKLFHYAGYVEGWGAYCEDIGQDIGSLQDIYQQLGKWEWDLVRSARLVLDVGLNYEGWTREQAFAYWHEHISNQDDIAQREIDRVLRWPAQSLSYKLGENKFLTLKKSFKEAMRDEFTLRKFHSLILQRGALPFEVLEKMILDFIADKKKQQSSRLLPLKN